MSISLVNKILSSGETSAWHIVKNNQGHGALEWTIKISSRNKENMALAYLFALGDTAVITSMPKCSHWQCDWSWKQPLNNHHLFGESCLKANHKIRNYLCWKTTDVYREFEYQIQPHIVRKILLNREGLNFYTLGNRSLVGI